MSTDFRIPNQIRISELLDGRLDGYGVREKVNRETWAQKKCLGWKELDAVP